MDPRQNLNSLWTLAGLKLSVILQHQSPRCWCYEYTGHHLACIKFLNRWALKFWVNADDFANHTPRHYYKSCAFIFSYIFESQKILTALITIHWFQVRKLWLSVNMGIFQKFYLLQTKKEEEDFQFQAEVLSLKRIFIGSLSHFNGF